MDILRALAILLVVYGHGQQFIHKQFGDFPVIPMFDGVELFFVLSGFLIGSILLKRFNQKESVSFIDLIKFWKRRWFRTLPTYYLVLLVLLVWNIITDDFPEQWWQYVIFIQNFTQPHPNFFSPAWSLSIEEWFYIFFPVSLFATTIIFKSKKYYKAIFFSISLIFIVSGILLRTWLLLDIEVERIVLEADELIRKIVVMRFDSIIYGVLGAVIKYYYPKTWFNSRHQWILPGLICLFVPLMILVHVESTPILYYTTFLYFTLTPLGCLMLVPFADSIQKGKGWIAKLIKHISLISYSVYLTHFSIVLFFMKNDIVQSNGYRAILVFLLYWIVVLLIGTLLYKFFESPATRLRDKI